MYPDVDQIDCYQFLSALHLHVREFEIRRNFIKMEEFVSYIQNPIVSRVLKAIIIGLILEF